MLDKCLIGHRLGTFSADVEKGRLQFFAKAIGQDQPVYFDEVAAHAAGHRALPVPPTFLKCLESDGRDLLAMLALLGWDLGRVLHAEQAFTYHRMAYAGDTLTFTGVISDLYEKKGGALQFVVLDSQVINQHGEHVADVRTSLVHR